MAKLDSCGPTYKSHFNLKFQKRSCQTPGMLVVHNCNGRTPIMVCDLFCIFPFLWRVIPTALLLSLILKLYQGRASTPAFLLMSPVTDGEQTEKCSP